MLVLVSIGLSVQEKKRKINFQDSSHGSHLGFLTGTILAIFNLQVTLMFPTKIQDSWLSVQEKRKINFKDGGHYGHLGFPISTILPFFDLHMSP